jgi:GTP pyrophosphokinase
VKGFTNLIDNFKGKLLLKSNYLSNYDVSQLKNAIEFAEKAHIGQFRISGEPYIYHPLSVCEILMDYKADVNLLIAALLHDVVEDTDFSISDIDEKFGNDVSLIVDGLTKVKKDRLKKEEFEAINIEKLILTSEKDIRVAIIKIADRIHNMRTLSVKKIEKKIPYANETLIFFVPLAGMLGLFNFKTELEELAFEYAPYYQAAKKMFDNYNAFFLPNLAIIKRKLQSISNGSNFIIDYKKQSVYSSLSLIHEGFHFSDSFEINIIAESIMDCYYFLGLIHQSFKPVEHRFEDNIAINKNLFQKKLMTKVNINSMEVKISIQSNEHFLINELGVFYYLNGRFNMEAIKKLIFKNKILQIKELSLSPIEFADYFSFEMLQDGITVFTPMMDTITLPIGSTVIDFGFALNPLIAKRMKHVIINGNVKPIETDLNNMDVIEIIVSEKETIHSDWLNYATTSTSINEINRLLQI